MGPMCCSAPFCVFQFKKTCFAKILRKRTEQILSEVPGKAPAQKVAKPLSRTFYHIRLSATCNGDELFIPILAIAD